MPEMSVEEKQKLLRKRRSAAEKIYAKALKDGFEFTPGAGKGLESKPWCECHNRNPCPVDKELGLI